MLKYVKEAVSKSKAKRFAQDAILESISDAELEVVLGNIEEDETDREEIEKLIDSIPEGDSGELSDNTTSDNISDAEIVNLVERLG